MFLVQDLWFLHDEGSQTGKRIISSMSLKADYRRRMHRPGRSGLSNISTAGQATSGHLSGARVEAGPVRLGSLKPLPSKSLNQFKLAL